MFKKILCLVFLVLIISGCATTERFVLYKCPQCNDAIYIEIPKVTNAKYLFVNFRFDNEDSIHSATIVTKDAKVQTIKEEKPNDSTNNELIGVIYIEQ